MAYLIVQGGSSLYSMNLSTGVATALTLPSGVTLSTTRKARFAVLNQWVAMVNSPSKNLAIDPEGTVRPLTLRPPTHPPSLAAGSSTGLTGAYRGKVGFRLRNSDGELLMESPLSPLSQSLTAANTDILYTDIAVSLDDISERVLYRTLSGGSNPNLFECLTLGGNVLDTVQDATADASLKLLPAMAETLVNPPGALPGIPFKNIIEWKSRLWAIADDPTLVDTVFFSETNKVYAWPNTVTTYPTGMDSQGIVAFAKRRNQLGLLKRVGVWQVSGTGSTQGIAVNNISVSQIAFDKAGCIAPDSVVTINDKVYWLGKDGVYVWDDNGVRNVSDLTVAPWFKTDTYFNRSRFANAFGRYNELRDAYELHLAAAGSSNEDRWISLSLRNGAFYGPHQTAALTPTHAGWCQDSNGLPMTLVGGSDGVVYTGNSTLARDGAATVIDTDIYGPWHSGDAPDIEHFWGELSVLSKIESAGTLSITPYVGRLDVAAGSVLSHTLTTGRERLRRLGDGALMRLRLRLNTVNQGFTLYGYEVPWHEVGRR